MNEMTSLQRVRAVLNGETPDRVPVIPQGFMFCAANIGTKIGRINRDPKKMAESQVLTQQQFGYDGCVIDVDDATLAEACGARALFRDDGVAIIDEEHPALMDLSEIDNLELPDPNRSGRLPEWLETTQRIMDAVGDHVFVMGRADQGPFDLLCLLRGAQEFMMDLLTEEPEVILHAMEWTTKAHIIFANAMLKIAHATSMGDSYASPNLVSPATYEKYALPFEQQVVRAVQTKERPYSIHICGNTTKIIDKMALTGSKILEVDWQMDMGEARAAVPDNVVLMGNIDPSDPLVQGTPEDVDRKAKYIIEKTAGRGLILSSGCAMGANTPPENVAAMVAAAKKYGTYEQLLRMRR
ncbi:MAG: uroporphyrinogen decarboxylase family protein [Eubacteriales bacterium]|nr:uroporphyrinogen decarboxylase family protein [Eubacteriales bacterium]